MTVVRLKKVQESSGGSKVADDSKLKKQKQILRDCISKDKSLIQELGKVGWTYEDLQYENNAIDRVQKIKAPTLLDYKKKNNDIPVVSFFSGAGGLDLGFETAGFKHLALFENNKIFCDTLRFNRPEWNVYGPPNYSGDVSDLDSIVADLSKKISGKKFEGIFVGGPPCQPFSIAANQRFKKDDENFKRVGFAHEKNGNLLFDYIEIIKHFRPKAFLIENVPGLIEVDGGKQLKKAYAMLIKAGYNIHNPLTLSAAKFNVPQQRVRLFIVGNRIDAEFKQPLPTEYNLNCGHIFDLSKRGVQNFETRSHSAESIARYMQLNYGQRDQLGRVDRLNPAQPSKTVIAGGANGGGRSHLHPYIPRTLSVRESARLQTFPDNYIFTGPVARQFTQVGNAVPPVLAAQIALSLLRSFY